MRTTETVVAGGAEDVVEEVDAGPGAGEEDGAEVVEEGRVDRTGTLDEDSYITIQ